MCGISGAFYSGPVDRPEAVVREIVASQFRRGPDCQAVEAIKRPGGGVVFGHNRLSIIDLSTAANQPMWDADRKYCVIYNGEVYNYIELRCELESLGHAFATQSDTEVILEAFKEWGKDAVERFNGMFALAIYSTEQDRLWLIRDRFGVKPLYYYCVADTLYFASTGTVIARECDLLPDLEYVARGIQYWTYEDDGEISPYAGLKALPAGHLLEVSRRPDGRIALYKKRYYDLRTRVAAHRFDLETCSTPELVSRVCDMLENAVDIRLRADVPVGVSLSGGLDSSSIAALLAERHPEVIGFTFGARDDRKSEGPLVEQLRRKTGIQVEYIAPTTEQIVTGFWATLEAQDAPFPGGSIVAQYLVYEAARARGVKVLLGGQGGDEVFMGYRKFHLFRMRELIHRKRYSEALAFALGMVPMLIAEAPAHAEHWRQRQRYSRAEGITTALRLPLVPDVGLGYDGHDPVWVRQMQDATRISLPTLLRYEDRNSMGNSVESRLPFVDYRVVELGLSLHETVKLRGGWCKWIVREAMKGRIPESIRVARFKRGFDVDQECWIYNGLGAAIRTALRDRLSCIKDLLPTGLDLNDAFSDNRLATEAHAMPEAIALLWLGERSS